MPSAPFSKANIDKAIARLPGLASAEIGAMREKAIAHGLDELAEACRRELALRPISLTADQASRSVEAARQAYGLGLADVIRMAFDAQPASDAERIILKLIAEEPGISFENLRQRTGMGDLGLAVGHLVYDRYGWFRGLIEQEVDQSSVLLLKDKSTGGVTYRLKPEAESAFRDLGII